MSAVERVEYMDNQRSGVITENINREKRIQRKYFTEQAASGMEPLPPPVPTTSQTALERVGIPEHLSTLRRDPESAIGESLSRNMWRSNTGYIMRDGPRMTSTFKQDYAYDDDEVELMKQQGFLDKKFNRKRDEFVSYVEASAKMTNLYKAAQK